MKLRFIRSIEKKKEKKSEKRAVSRKKIAAFLVSIQFCF